jgi:putative FmdB family regulatory protein
MPTYDYSCKACEAEFEIFHGISEKPKVSCPKCGSKDTFKMISVCSIAIHNTGRVRAATDRFKRESEQRADLRQNYGVEKITPLRRGATINDIYKEVKSQGTFVRDKMQLQKEIDEAKRKAKRREWQIKANKRAPAKYEKIKEERAKEAAAKRAIKI